MERRAGDFQNGIRLVFCYFQMARKSTFTERPLLRINGVLTGFSDPPYAFGLA